MTADRDELVKIIWAGAVADRVKDGKDPDRVPIVRPKVEALPDAILAAGYGKSSDRRPSVVTDAGQLRRRAKSYRMPNSNPTNESEVKK